MLGQLLKKDVGHSVVSCWCGLAALVQAQVEISVLDILRPDTENMTLGVYGFGLIISELDWMMFCPNITTECKNLTGDISHIMKWASQTKNLTEWKEVAKVKTQ